MRFRDVKEHHTRTVLPVAHITHGADAPHRSHRKPIVLFVFGEHARELITSEVGLWLARLLVDNSSAVYEWPELAAAFERAENNTSSSSNSGSSSGRDWPSLARSWVQEVLAKVEVQIVPIESLDSRRQVEEGKLCVRKTARNVDLNRNWPFAWQKEDPGDEQYGGTTPFSEPQSRLMKQVVDANGHRLLGYVNVHSGEWALYTPWDSKPAYGSGMPADMPELVATVGRICNCKVGPAGAVSGYLAFGSSMDFLYVAKRVPYPLTVEVYGGGGFGKLQPGEANKPLAQFDLIARPDREPAAPAPLPRRRALQQQQQQRQHQQQVQHSQQQPQLQAQLKLQQAEPQQQHAPDRWSHTQLLSRLNKASQKHSSSSSSSNSSSSSSSQGAARPSKRRRLRHRLHLLDAGSSAADALLPAAAVFASRSAAAGGAGDGVHAVGLLALPHPDPLLTAADTDGAAVAAGGLPGIEASEQQQQQQQHGFMHAQRLPALRQQALLQITKSQLEEEAHSAANPDIAAAASAGLAAAAAMQATGRVDTALAWQQQQQPPLDVAATQQQVTQQAGDADVILGLVARAAKDQQACFNMFNPPNEAEYRRVVADWLASFLLMLRHMANGEGYKTVEATVSQRRSSRG
uniref:Peptidase M14 domain-containing protein n=1 Tax=Tetradesmus obliquus TaxID=3088 RepID=A0A383WP64_TETOB|eukprot:jgi/Sobl393_1/13840/SZX78959.1